MRKLFLDPPIGLEIHHRPCVFLKEGQVQYAFADIRTTLNVYGDVVTDEMAQANSKVAKMALSRTN
jgi:hypothetical protein